MSDEYSFYITADPPDPGPPFGTGRTRKNPFDLPVKQSFEQKLVDKGEWVAFKVDDPASMRREINRIRSAGQYLRIGTEVRADRETGLIAFRGTEYKPRDTKRNGSKAEQPGTPPAPEAAAQPPAAGPPGAAPWDWQGSQR